jgi:hypothetical protein
MLSVWSWVTVSSDWELRKLYPMILLPCNINDIYALKGLRSTIQNTGFGYNRGLKCKFYRACLEVNYAVHPYIGIFCHAAWSTAYWHMRLVASCPAPPEMWESIARRSCHSANYQMLYLELIRAQPTGNVFHLLKIVGGHVGIVQTPIVAAFGFWIRTRGWW